MIRLCFSVTVTAMGLFLFFLYLPFSAGQDITAAPTMEVAESDRNTDPIEPYKISLDVNEVRLDVVVVDNKGRPITDLTAADFEVYQNKLPQDVTSSLYISNQTDAASQPALTQKNASNLAQLPGKTLKEEEVSRTILFVVDNISMEFEHLHYAKTGIKGFLEKQMQPGDLVAVMRTSYGNSALNFFSSDKRQLTARTDSIPFEGLGEGSACAEERLHRIFGNQLSTLSYSIRALKDMPGRKIVFFMTSCPTMPTSVMTEDILGIIPTSYPDYYGKSFNRLADEALRAGVVIHTMDAKGLEIVSNNNPLNAHAMSELSYKTGGLYVENSNFFVNGIGNDANNMIAGYYLVSYVPPSSTFNISRRNIYHRVDVRVKRKGAVVYTREGFYGRTGNEPDPAAPAIDPLQDAIFSPFLYADLNVNMAAGYVKDAKAGYLVRSWIHVDPKNITIIETEDGGARIVLETVCLTSDVDGYVHDYKHIKYTFDIEPEKKSENIEWVQKHGLRFSMLLPVKKPGQYAVRIAIQDAETGKVGSAYQSVAIPDLKKKGLALSNIFMITSADDLDWMRSDATKEIDEGLFFPILHKEEVRSPALRAYIIGDSLQTLAILYNADAKSIARSEIEMHSVLYKDGDEFIRTAPRPINLESAENHDGIILLQRLTMGSDMPTGDYVLQLVVTDKKNSKKKEGVASETLFFSILE